MDQIKGLEAGFHPKSARRMSPKHAPSPLEWEGGEHTFIGNQITLQFPAGPVKPIDAPFTMQNGSVLTYGQILALAGDFYGVVGQPICDDPAPPTVYNKAFGSLSSGDPAELAKILEIMQQEIDAVNQAIKNGSSVFAVYEDLGDTLSAKWNRATGGGVTDQEPWLPLGRYLELASTNWDHFSPWSTVAYKIGHKAAMTLAAQAGAAGNVDQLRQAYALNAFADHFLSDMFSAGHMRTPRKQLWQECTPSNAGSYCARYMHDEDCSQGLTVTNQAGQTWLAYGDKAYFEPANKTNAAICLQAVQASADDIHSAYMNPAIDPTTATALQLVPNTAQLLSQSGPPNGAALFKSTTNGVLRRSVLADRTNYSWGSWLTLPTLAKLKAMTPPGLAPARFAINANFLLGRQSPSQPNMVNLVLLAPSANGFAPSWSGDNMSEIVPNATWLSGDFDGDGLAEIVQIGIGGTFYVAVVYQEAASGYLAQPPQALGGASNPTQFYAADVDGDGIKELVMIETGSVDMTIAVYKLKNGVFGQVTSTTKPSAPFPVTNTVVDFFGTGQECLFGATHISEPGFNMLGLRVIAWDTNCNVSFDDGIANYGNFAAVTDVYFVKPIHNNVFVVIGNGGTVYGMIIATDPNSMFRTVGQPAEMPDSVIGGQLHIESFFGEGDCEIAIVNAQGTSINGYAWFVIPPFGLVGGQGIAIDAVGPSLAQFTLATGPNLQDGLVLVNSVANPSPNQHGWAIRYYGWENGNFVQLSSQTIDNAGQYTQATFVTAVPVSVLSPVLPD